MMKENILYISVTVIAATVVAVVGAFLIYSKTNQFPPSPIPSWSSLPVACTMEAKLCPDGTAVGRGGPNCEFAPCPVSSPLPGNECKYNSDCPAGYLCIQSCGPPVVREDDPPPPYYCEKKEIAEKPRICPICLASNTDIFTPSDPVNVKDIKIGMIVWSLDKNGKKIKSAVARVSNTPVTAAHQMVHLVLSDKREAWVSPGHPTANGLPVSELRTGNFYDGSIIELAEIVPYWDNVTYDILPDSDTGYYWANDILFGSTLATPQVE